MSRVPVVVGAVAVTVHVFAQQVNTTSSDASRAQTVLWRDHGPIGEKDLFWGAGSPERAPVAPFTFIEENTGGTKPKVLVTDANGVRWSVKFAGPSPSNNEVHAEIAATRLAWAFGFLVEEHYYVPQGTIANVRGLRRAAASIDAAGNFRTARFERRPPEVTRTGRHWSLRKNPFKGTRELSGLQLVLALVNNWDTKPSNFSIFEVTTPSGEREQWYLVSDWGSSFGRMGPLAMFPSRNRWSLRHYEAEEFVEGVDSESVNINHKGDLTINEVPLDHARWFANLASPLTIEQVRRAFEAAGASQAEIDGFSTRVMEKLAELHAALATRQRLRAS
jgi:hypothetical protein